MITSSKSLVSKYRVPSLRTAYPSSGESDIVFLIMCASAFSPTTIALLPVKVEFAIVEFPPLNIIAVAISFSELKLVNVALLIVTSPFT